jgi:hypothetical protein
MARISKGVGVKQTRRGFTIELQGIEELQKKLIAGGSRVVPAVAQAMNEEGQIIFDKSQDLVPVETAALINSGRLELAKQVGNALEIEITYGGSAASYAMYVHEDPDAIHDEGKTYNYLGGPMTEAAPQFFTRVNDRVDRILRGA